MEAQNQINVKNSDSCPFPNAQTDIINKYPPYRKSRIDLSSPYFVCEWTLLELYLHLYHFKKQVFGTVDSRIKRPEDLLRIGPAVHKGLSRSFM